MIVYNVIHLYNLGDNIDNGNCKSLGFYSGYSKALDAIEYYKQCLGFCDHKNGFVIVPYDIKTDSSDLEYIYETYLYVHDDMYDYEYSQLLGLWDNYDDANKMVEKFKDSNAALSFDSSLELDVDVCRHKLNTGEWREGFTTYYW